MRNDIKFLDLKKLSRSSFFFHYKSILLISRRSIFLERKNIHNYIDISIISSVFHLRIFSWNEVLKYLSFSAILIL